jgi:hypothetical protein
MIEFVTCSHANMFFTALSSNMSTSIDALVDGAQAALAEYASFTQEQVDHIVRKASVGELVVRDDADRLLIDDRVRHVLAREHSSRCSR